MQTDSAQQQNPAPSLQAAFAQENPAVRQENLASSCTLPPQPKPVPCQQIQPQQPSQSGMPLHKADMGTVQTGMSTDSAPINHQPQRLLSTGLPSPPTRQSATSPAAANGPGVSKVSYPPEFMAYAQQTSANTSPPHAKTPVFSGVTYPPHHMVNASGCMAATSSPSVMRPTLGHPHHHGAYVQQSMAHTSPQVGPMSNNPFLCFQRPPVTTPLEMQSLLQAVPGQVVPPALPQTAPASHQSGNPFTVPHQRPPIPTPFEMQPLQEAPSTQMAVSPVLLQPTLPQSHVRLPISPVSPPQYVLPPNPSPEQLVTPEFAMSAHRDLLQLFHQPYTSELSWGAMISLYQTYNNQAQILARDPSDSSIREWLLLISKTHNEIKNHHKTAQSIPRLSQHLEQMLANIPKIQSKYFSPQARNILEEWYQENKDNPYAVECQAIELGLKARISKDQVQKWLSNKRNREGNTKKRKRKHEDSDDSSS